MDGKKVKVIYILGYERSGSTILHNLIGQMPAFFSVGELRHIWRRGNDNRPCGCGQPFKDCSFWQGVYDHQNPYKQHFRESLFAITKLMSVIPSLRKRLTGHKAYLKELYTKALEKSGKEYIVDHSKSVMHLKLLSQIEGFDVKTIHIVRDPRGIEYSMYKRQLKGLDRYKNYSVWKNVIKIDLVNHMAQRFMDRYSLKTHTLRYEDLVRQPKETLEKMTNDLEIASDFSFIEEDGVILQPTHSVGGSPSRHNTGKIQLKLDDKWKASLPDKKRKRIEGFSSTYKKWYRNEDLSQV